MNLYAKYTLLGFFCLFMTMLHGQDRKTLEHKRKQLQLEIQKTNELLANTEKQKLNTLSRVELLHQKITQRQVLINTIKKETELINGRIFRLKKEIEEKEKELEQLKDEYARLIRRSYLHQNSASVLMYIFMAEDFNQAYLRLKYIRQYNDYRRKQAENILKTKTELKDKIAQLEDLKKLRENLLVQNELEKQLIEKEKIEQEQLVQKLKSEEENLRQQLKKKQKDAEELNKKIEEIIRKEIEEARRKAAEKNKTSKTGEFPMTPEAQKLSNSFTANKGKLPWPVDKGVITGKFGQYEHPVIKGVIVNNNGIDIKTEKEAYGKAIFDGEVSSVVIIPGAGKAVMIRHGEYLTVYSYFSEVFVKKGDKVKTRQNIGILVPGDDNASSTMHLEIWKQTVKLNPEYWLAR